MMPFEEDTIAYSRTAADGALERLQRKIEAGEVRLEHEPGYGYLRSILRALEISETSQVLVFSKTSLQRERISPRNPRAIFFNDDVYVGFIPGSPLLEVSVAEPKLGGVFYTLEQQKVERPRFVRNDNCLECHASAKTMGVPGHLIRSFETDDSGIVNLASGTSLVNHRTPLADRWGGWYVTGHHGAELHRGNLIGAAAFARQRTEPNHLGNIMDLSPFFDVSRYPKNQSDIVALMVLEHQAHMHNFLTRLNYQGSLALHQYGHIRYMKSSITAFLRYLLFTEEIPLRSPLTGSPDYVKAFEAAGPRDRQGRSLRELDMKSRLFKHPCSYLIYTDAFDQLPAPVREEIYTRLDAILAGRDESGEFDSLSRSMRRTIREILIDTKPDLAGFWNRSAEKVAAGD